MKEENLGQNLGQLNHALKKQICHETMDECFRLPVPLTWPEIVEKCKESVNRKEKELNISPFSPAFSKETFNNYVKELKKRSITDLGIKLPLKKKSSGKINDSPLTRDGRNKSKQRSLAAYYYTDKGFTLFPKPLDEIDRKKIQEIGAYLKNVSSRWQNDMLEDITQGLEILQLDLNTTQPKVQYELPYHLDENQLQTFKLLYRAIEKQQVIGFEYDRHNAPGEDYFEGKSEEEIRKIRYKVVMSPYFLKQSQNRWFLLGKSHLQYLEFEDYLMPVSIERLKKIKIREDLDYQPNLGITLKDYYQNLVGISMERNQEKQSCCFVTTLENLETIKNRKPKSSNSDSTSKTKEQTPYKVIFGDFDPSGYQAKLLNIDLDFSSYNDKEHQLMEFKGVLNPEILMLIQKNPNDVKLLFPFHLQKGDFMFKNGRYLLIQISNHLSGEASKLDFELIAGISPKNELQRRFSKLSLDLVFGENSESRGIIAVFRGVKVDTELIKLLSQPEIKRNVSLLTPKNLLRKAISQNDVKNIILEVNKTFAHYVVSKPFHESQKSLEFDQVKELIELNEKNFKWNQEENQDCVYFQLDLIPNKEIENQILAKGDQIKVIYPFNLRKKLADRVKKMYQLYYQPKEKSTLVLEVDRNFAQSLIAQPLHPSQRTIEFTEIKGLLEKEGFLKWNQTENKDCVYFLLKLNPTNEFIARLNSLSDQITILYAPNLVKK